MFFNSNELCNGQTNGKIAIKLWYKECSNLTNILLATRETTLNDLLKVSEDIKEEKSLTPKNEQSNDQEN